MSGVRPSQTAERGWCGPERSDYPVPLGACLGLDGKGGATPTLHRHHHGDHHQPFVVFASIVRIEVTSRARTQARVTRAREHARPRPTFAANQTGTCPGWIPVMTTHDTSPDLLGRGQSHRIADDALCHSSFETVLTSRSIRQHTIQQFAETWASSPRADIDNQAAWLGHLYLAQEV